MAVWDLYSKRLKRQERAGQDDVLQYDDLPKPFRVQVIHIWSDALGGWYEDSFGTYAPNGWWTEIVQTMARELGVFRLSDQGRNPFDQCGAFLMTADTLRALDLIELTFQFADIWVRRLDPYERKMFELSHPDDAIKELNQRFKEHDVGYEYAGSKIIHVDSKYLHAEAVKPALHLLQDAGAGFSGPLQEFLRAHEKHRKGEQKEAIAEALKAFESTLKAICTARGWPFDPSRDTASKLIEIAFQHNLIPSYLQAEFTALRSVLEAGLPTVRNKTSGHGQGATPTTVPDYLAEDALHLVAANIVFLVEAYKALP